MMHHALFAATVLITLVMCTSKQGNMSQSQRQRGVVCMNQHGGIGIDFVATLFVACRYGLH